MQKQKVTVYRRATTQELIDGAVYQERLRCGRIVDQVVRRAIRKHEHLSTALMSVGMLIGLKIVRGGRKL